MTPVGHSLLGAAIGVLCLPGGSSVARKAGHCGAFALLANLPDWPIPNWGHDRYDISHSVFVNALLIGVGCLGAARWPGARPWTGGPAVLAAAGAAWLSHLLLDALYNHGRGVAICWPFSEARLALPIPWFSVVGPPPPFTGAMLEEFAIEFCCYAPLVVAAIVWRRLRRRSG